MFGGITRLLRRPAPYARRVTVELLQEGFDPALLAEFGSLHPEGSIFRILADRRLKPADAALAIRLASRRFIETRAYLHAAGERAMAKRPLFPPHEAYFLQLLEEATESLRFTH